MNLYDIYPFGREQLPEFSEPVTAPTPEDCGAFSEAIITSVQEPTISTDIYDYHHFWLPEGMLTAKLGYRSIRHYAFPTDVEVELNIAQSPGHIEVNRSVSVTLPFSKDQKEKIAFMASLIGNKPKKIGVPIDIHLYEPFTTRPVITDFGIREQNILTDSMETLFEDIGFRMEQEIPDSLYLKPHTLAADPAIAEFKIIGEKVLSEKVTEDTALDFSPNASEILSNSQMAPCSQKTLQAITAYLLEITAA